MATIDECKLFNTSGGGGTASIPRAHFERMIKFLLKDYIWLKSDNEGHRRELQSRDKTIDVLRKVIDECKVVQLEKFLIFFNKDFLNKIQIHFVYLRNNLILKN